MAFSVTVLCLWMATGGVVGHTDDFRTYSSTSGNAVWGHTVAASAPADACAACQWLAGVQAVSVAVSVAVSPNGFERWPYPALNARRFGRLLAQNGSRAPPTS